MPRNLPFPPNAPLTEITLKQAAARLAAVDRDLALILHLCGPPPMWSRKPGFATLIQIILEQQVSLASAAAVYRKLRHHVVPFTPRGFLLQGEIGLRGLGLTRQKAGYCLHLAESILAGKLHLPTLSRLPDEPLKETLMIVRGIGSWTADIYLLMALRRPDIWPASDLALAASIARLKKLNTIPLKNEMSDIGESWRPLRSVAARMLWQYYLAGRAGTLRTAAI